MATIGVFLCFKLLTYTKKVLKIDDITGKFCGEVFIVGFYAMVHFV